MSVPSRVLLAALVCLLMISTVVQGEKFKRSVTYDGRSLIINGKRELFFSGSIHYPRMPPEVLNFYFRIVDIICLILCVCFGYANVVACLINFVLRCGGTYWKRLKLEDWMWFRLMFSGTFMNQRRARYTCQWYFLNWEANNTRLCNWYCLL